MSLTVKAFLYRRSWREEPLEIRRFSLDQDVSTSYSYLVQKIAQVFPSVPAEDILLSWADSEGDHITISSDDELVEALDQFDGSIFKIHLRKREKPRSFYCQQPVYCTPLCQPPQQQQSQQGGDEKMEEDDGGEKQQQPPSSDADSEPTQQQKQASQQGQSRQRAGPYHIGVVCDGCGSGIYGIRFKCLVCPDYDLCSSCEHQGKHVVHNMVTINNPHTYNPWGFHGGRFNGPWHGRGGQCHGRGGGRSGAAPWMSPNFLQNLFGGAQFGQGGGGTPQGCCGQQPPQEKKSQPQAKPEEMETGSGENAQLEQEQRQSYLQDIGEAVSSFLRPFGVKVDVGVVDEEKTKKEASSEAKTTSSDVPSGYEGNTLYPTLDAATNAPTTHDQQSDGAGVDSVEVAVTKLRGMGFDNEGGWLTELVRAKGGDIEKVLDALHPSQSD